MFGRLVDGVGALGVVVFDVSGDRRASGGEVVKAVLPGAFPFEGADEVLAQSVPLGTRGLYDASPLGLGRWMEAG